MEFFHFPPHPDLRRGPPSLLTNEYGVLTPVVRRSGSEADHLHVSSARVKNAWSYTSTPSIAWCFVNHRDTLPLP
jgi:hypothetical protein